MVSTQILVSKNVGIDSWRNFRRGKKTRRNVSRLFIDLKSAYDLVDLNYLQRVIEMRGIFD